MLKPAKPNLTSQHTQHLPRELVTHKYLNSLPLRSRKLKNTKNVYSECEFILYEYFY